MRNRALVITELRLRAAHFSKPNSVPALERGGHRVLFLTRELSAVTLEEFLHICIDKEVLGKMYLKDFSCVLACLPLKGFCMRSLQRCRSPR